MEFINQFTHSGKPVTDLSRAKRLLGALGDPQDKLAFVHIAGTNGKGSVAEMFNRIFISAGLKNRLFHLAVYPALQRPHTHRRV